jgi:methylenetetrahydrofolate--tRNA-(uracil-5-)-methyltransferase
VRRVVKLTALNVSKKYLNLQGCQVEQDIIIIGGGLAGCEAAWQAAQRGLKVKLYEMRPRQKTGAHVSDKLAELVCSNSLGSSLPDRASGILKAELTYLNSMLLECALESALPAGTALAVDRERFSQLVTKRISNHPNISVIRQEVTEIPETLTIVASGPLTSPALSKAIASVSGDDHLYFYDAIAPVIAKNSINMEIAFYASRYGNGALQEGDYINCPFTETQYSNFVEALVLAERIEIKEFERELEGGVKAGFSHFFEGCLPVEIIARRGRQSLAFGPMRPVGLIDPRSGRRPYAVVQLRQDNLAGDLYNMVGFQTNLKFSEQKRVLGMIPGLENAEFLRYGQMHRNTFIASPKLLKPTLQYHDRSDLFFAGQIIGVEGYLGNVATGLLAGLNASRIINHDDPLTLPTTTMLGALCQYITSANLKDFQPMKANLGILPPLEDRFKSKSDRAMAYAERSAKDLNLYMKDYQINQTL